MASQFQCRQIGGQANLKKLFYSTPALLTLHNILNDFSDLSGLIA
jgi:hypothetical protein